MFLVTIFALGPEAYIPQTSRDEAHQHRHLLSALTFVVCTLSAGFGGAFYAVIDVEGTNHLTLLVGLVIDIFGRTEIAGYTAVVYLEKSCCRRLRYPPPRRVHPPILKTIVVSIHRYRYQARACGHLCSCRRRRCGWR